MITVEGVTFKPAIMANNMSFVRKITIEGAGIGYLVEENIRSEKKEGSLVRLFPEKTFHKSPIQLVFTSKKLSKRVSLFVQEIIKHREKFCSTYGSSFKP